MTRAISIRPSKDLRTNYAQISSLAKTNPVAITVNGREDIVILSHEDYIDQMNYISELEARLKLYSHLIAGMEDAKAGRVSDLDSVKESIMKEIDEIDL